MKQRQEDSVQAEPKERSFLALLEELESERRSFGQELHDNLCQRLKGLELKMAALRVPMDENSQTARLLLELERELDASLAVAHDLSAGALPAGLRKEEFSDSMAELAKRNARRFAMKISFKMKRSYLPPSDNAAMQLYRIAQEAIRNAALHGKAKRIDVEISSTEPGLSLSVKDDGQGFKPEAVAKSSRIGLRLMQFRAVSLGASITVDSAPGKGTRIVCAPLPGARSESKRGLLARGEHKIRQASA